MTLPRGAADTLAAKSYVLLPEPPELARRLADAYAAWAAFFASAEKFEVPTDPHAPAGYQPCRQPGGWEMKESFYVQPDRRLPAIVREPTRRLLSLLVRRVGAVAAELEAAFGRPLIDDARHGCLRVMRYPAAIGEAESDMMRVLMTEGARRLPEHTDLNAITILPSPTAPGLELLDPDDGWRLIDAEPGRTVVHVGRQLEMRTEGALRATIHRVRNPTPAEGSRSRLALAFFAS